MRNLHLALTIFVCVADKFTLGYHDQLRTENGERKRRKHKLYVVESEDEFNEFDGGLIDSKLLSMEDTEFWNRVLLESHSMMSSSSSMPPVL
mmetsp:Transcript_2686/g.3919  ORF Transcript_2686/g.3919 Transcript_2686/m.3919 type:complete len:92 (-) Transcript_2686:69-344(-)